MVTPHVSASGKLPRRHATFVFIPGDARAKTTTLIVCVFDIGPCAIATFVKLQTVGIALTEVSSRSPLVMFIFEKFWKLLVEPLANIY